MSHSIARSVARPVRRANRIFPSPHAWRRMALRLTPGVAALCGAGLWLQPVSAQQIVPDGRTATTLSTHSNVTDVMTATQRGANAFNSFVRFDVNQGNIANLHVPNTASNLINIVTGSTSNIFGVLNAVKNGQIGGNVWFANPHGMVVGSTGVVNVGSLHVSAPTPGFVANFFTAPGTPNDGAVAQLLSGTAPRNTDATITIDGTVNAVDTVSVSAGAVNVGGAIYSGARFIGNAPHFSDVVNANGMATANRVVERGGKILIVADGDVGIQGTLNVDGAPGVQAGDVSVRTDGQLRLDPGAHISAKGVGVASDGGNVNLWADQSAVARGGALVDASAGSSGKGGEIEFSARRTVELAGGEFRADGRGAAAGHVLIDPANIVVSAHILRTDPGYGSLPDGGSVSGADLTLLANESVTINDNVVVSSRMVGSDDVAVHVSGNSTGDSGNITLAAPSITLKSGSQVLAQGGNGWAGGTVTLNAASQPMVSILGYREANASIQIGDANGGATVRGATVDLKASTDISTKWVYQKSDGGSYIDDPTDLDTAGRTLALGASTGAEAAVGFLATLVGVNLVHSQAVATSTVLVKAGSTIDSTGDVTLRAENTTTAGAAPNIGINGPGTQVDTPLGLGALYARNKSIATVTVEGNATIKSRNLDVRAHNTAAIEAEIASADAGSDSGDIAIALGVTNADIQAKALVAQGANIKVTGQVSVAATNVNTFNTSVEAQTGAGGKAAAAIAVSEISTKATAELQADVRDATSINVVAINDNQKNATTANSKAGQSLNDMIQAGMKEKLESLTDPSGALENFLWDKLLSGAQPDAKVQPKSTPFRIGGAIAYTNSSAEANALVGDNTQLHATDHIAVVARTQASDLQIAADASAVSQSRERAAANTARTTFSAGVAIGNYRHDALAKVGQDAVITAPRVGVAADVVLPVRESILTGGSFDRWSDLSTIGSWLDSITNAFDIFNGSSSASSTSDNSDNAIALSGSVNLLDYQHTARAVLDTGAKINLSGTATGAWSQSFEVVPDDASTTDTDEQVRHDWAFDAPAHLRADRDLTLLFHGGKFLPSDGGAAKGLGLAYTQTTLTGVTETIVREGATIQGVDESASVVDADGLRTWTVDLAHPAGEVQLTAQASDLLISIAASGGYGGSFGLNGAASIVAITNSTRALVDDEAVLKAETISLLAKDTPVSWSIAGGFNKSSSSGVGIGIGYNSVTTHTYAEIADNDAYQAELALARASRVTATGSVLVRDLSLEARSGGHVETIAVTAAIASDSDSAGGGFFSSVKDKYESIQGKLAGLVDIKPGSTSQTSGSSQGTGKNAKNSFGLSGAGSGAINEAELNTVARVEGATITQMAGAGDNSLLVRGVADMDVITASGAAALTRANKSSQTGSAAIAGSVSVNMIDNATRSILRDSTVVNADDVTVQALQGGEQLSIAIGMAIDASNQSSKTKSLSLTGSLSLSFVENDVIAQMDGVILTGQAGMTGRDVDVVAYNRTFIGTGGGSLSAGGKKAAGAAVTYSDITNTVDASITGGSQLTAVDTVGVAATNATEIGAGAAFAVVSTGSNSQALGGAVVITEITNTTTATIDGLSAVTASGRIEVLARDRGADTLLEDIIEPGSHRENTVAGLDYCGSSSGVASTPGGNCITSVAGIVQVTPGGGSSNIGLSFNWSQIANNLTAKVEDAAVSADTLAVQAESNTTITGLAVGVGVADKTSAVGSVTVNRINNHIEAAVRAPSNNGAFDTVFANTVDLSAKDKSRIDTLAGQVTVSMNGAAVGAAVTYAEIGNQALAQIDAIHVHAPGSVMLMSGNDARIRTLAAAGSVVAAGSSPAVSASIAVNFIGNTTESSVSDAQIDDSAGGSNVVTVAAQDTSQIQSLAGSVSVSGTSAAGGGAFAYNQIGNTVTGAIDNSTLVDAATLDVSAAQTSKIQNITAAVGGGQTVAISGSVSLNQIGRYGDSSNPDEDGNVTTARISHTSVSNGATAASVKASDTSSIASLAGAVSISIGSAAVGGAVADNAIRNVAKATVSDAAFDGSANLTVEADNGSTIDSLSVAGAGAATGAVAGSASSNRTGNRTIGEIVDSSMTGSAANVRVAAIDSAAIRSLAGAVGIAGSGGVGAAVAVNKIDNTTDAHVAGTRAPASGYAVADLIVLGDSTSSIQTLAAGVGAGADVGVAGSAAINLIGSNTRASISGGAKVQATGSVAVVAESDDTIEVAAGAAGVGAAAAGVAASTAVNQIDGTTEAVIAGAGTEVQARALTGAGFLVDTGVLSGEVDLAGIVGGSTTSIDLAGMRQQETVQGLAVNASSTHQLRTTAVNIAAGLYAGVGATANVNVIGGDTRASITDARINGGDNSGAGATQQVQVRASDHAYANTFIGGVSGGLAGVGAAADVNVFDRDTLASVVGSTVDAKGKHAVEAWSTQGVSSLVVGLSGGGFAAVGTGALAKFTSRTEAWTDDAILRVGALDVIADHDTHMFLSAGAVALGGVAFAGTFAVGLDNNITKAFLDGGSVDATGLITVKAESDTELRNIGVSGSGAGGNAVAGMAVLGLIGNTTQSYVTGARIGSVATASGALSVTAKDVVTVDNKAGAAAVGGSAGIGLGAGVTKIANTVSAYVVDSDVDVAGDFVVDALAQRDLYTFAATAGVSAGFSLAGAAGVTIVGSTLSNEAKNSLGTDTDSQVDGFASKDRLSSGGNIDTNDNFSQSDIDSINSSAKAPTSSTLATSALAPGSLAQRTKAQVSGGAGKHVTAGNDVRVSALEQDKAAMQVGSVAVGVVALGGSVGFLDITNNVESEVSGGLRLTSTGGKIDVTAQAGKLAPGDAAADVQTLQGSGGIVGLGAAVSKAVVTNNVASSIGAGTNTSSLTGNVTVQALDTSDLNAQAVGLNVGLVGAGVTIATAQKSGSTSALVGGNTSNASATQLTLGDDTLRVQASRSGKVHSDATAGAGGIIAGSGADTTATDSGLVLAGIGNAVTVTTTNGNVEVQATATPQTEAEARGINVGAGAVGASLAHANADADVLAQLGAGSNITAARLDVEANRTIGAEPAARAYALGASGGYLIGVNATSATSESGGQTSANVGDDSRLTVSGALTVQAHNDTDQRADVTGLAVGIVAAGASEANARSTTGTYALLGDNVNIAGGASGSVTILATGKDTNIASAVSGSGGVVAGAAASANTATISDTRAAVGESTCGKVSPSCGIVTGSFSLHGEHDSVYNGKVDSTQASIAGASGSSNSHTVVSTLNVDVGDKVKVTAGHIDVSALNATHKYWWGRFDDTNTTAVTDGAAWNVDSGSGGLIGAPAGSTVVTLLQNTTLSLGDNSLFHVPPLVGAGSFTVDANNLVVAYDKVKIDSGGAIALADSSTKINASTQVHVDIGDGTVITSDSGDIDIGSRTDARIDARAVANAYGLAGLPAAEAYIDFIGANTTTVAADALLLATDAAHGAITVSAGRDSAGGAGSIDAHSAVNMWNKTAVPINTTPDARTNVSQDATLSLDGGSKLLAAGDIDLAADRGAIAVSAKGVAKDLYRELAGAIAGAIGISVSLDITGGSAPTPGGLAQVNVDGTVLSGLLRQSATQIDPVVESVNANGSVVWQTSYSRVDNLHTAAGMSLADNPIDASLTNTFVQFVQKTAPAPGGVVVESDVAPNSLLLDRITKLQGLRQQYQADPVASAAYQSEIDFLTAKLGPQGIGQTSVQLTARGSAALDAAGAVDSALDNYQNLITGDIRGIVTNTVNGELVITATNDPARQKGAVGRLVDAYVQADANNTTINTNLVGMARAPADPTVNATYQSLTTERGTAQSNYLTLRGAVTDIGNYAFACAVSDCPSAPLGPLGTLISTTDSGLRTVNGSGYLAGIQDNMRNISQLALGQSGASGTLITNVAGLATLMTNIGTANSSILTSAGNIRTALNNASVQQGALSLAWRDLTAGNGNVDTTRVATVAGKVSANGGLLAAFNVATPGSDANVIATNAALVAAAATAATNNIAVVSAADNTPAPTGSQKRITFRDITVRLGNVGVSADVLAGTGSLQAPGDGKIWILNNAPASMNIGNLTVDSEGGNVRLNGFLINDTDDVRRANPSYTGAVPDIVSRENGAAGAPEIRVVSTYDPGAYDPNSSFAARRIPAGAPDVTLGYQANINDPDKVISNPNGLVYVESRAGDVYVDGRIAAGSVSVKALNGDFVQKYVNGFNSIAGEPKDNIQGGTGVLPPGNTVQPGPGIVANGHVFLSARYLNINGLVQSGIVNFHLDIPDDAALQFRLPNNMIVGKAYIDTVYRQPVEVVVGTNGIHDDSAIGATYDPATQTISMNANAKVRGGTITLFGQIINTANGSTTGVGKLAVLDGFGQVVVNNNSSLKVELKSIDTGVDPDPANPGRGTVGIIDITDVQYVGRPTVQFVPTSPSTFNVVVTPDPTLYAIHTIISRDQDQITVDQTGQWNNDGSFCLTCTTSSSASDQNAASRVSVSAPRLGAFNPQAGLRYVYTTGSDTSTTYTWTFKGQSFFGTSSLSLPPNNVSRTLSSGPNVLKNYDLPGGNYLSYIKPTASASAHQNNLQSDTAMTQNAGATSADAYRQKSNTYQTSSVYTKLDEWNDCDWWSLCISSKYTSIWKQVNGDTTVVTNSVKADYPIQIEFLGANTAGLTVNSPLAEVALANQAVLNNRYGNTTIVTRQLTAGDGAMILTNDLSVTASTGAIGAAVAPVHVLMGGVLSASAVNGDIVLQQVGGPLQVGSVSAGGLVDLTALGDIYGSAGNLVRGRRVELTSMTGAIGGIPGNPGAHPALNVAPGYTDNRSQQPQYGLKAWAAGDIGIDTVATPATNAQGHLLADTIVSAGGDVRLSAPGQILDNNPNQSIDTRVWNELLGFWDSVGLVAGSSANTAKVGQAVNAFESSRNQDYFQYWQIRQMQNAPTSYDPAWHYVATSAERDALTARSQDIAAFEQSRTDRYWSLNTEIAGFDAQVFARSQAAADVRKANASWTQAQVSDQVLLLEQQGRLPTVAVPTVYRTGFQYVATQDERATFLDTVNAGAWTTTELALSINPGLLKGVTDTNPVIKAPNVAGRNVTLVAGTSLGSTLPSTDPSAVFIAYDTDGNISDPAKIALATAEYSDFSFDVTQGGKQGLLIEQRLPFNFSASHALTVAVRDGGILTNNLTAHVQGTDVGNAYLASLGAGTIDSLSVDGELRLKTKGPITALDPLQVVIRAGDLILEAANASIGGNSTAQLPLLVDVARGIDQTADSFGSVTARSAGPVNIAAVVNLNVGGVFSRGAVVLTSVSGSILDAHPGTGLDVLGGTLQLLAPMGSIGDIHSDQPLTVGTNTGTPLAGLIEAAAGQSIYLSGNPFNAPVGSNFAFGPVAAGHDALNAGAAIRITAFDPDATTTINGNVIGVGPIEIAVSGDLLFSGGRDITLQDLATPPATSVLTLPAAHLRVTGVGTWIDARSLLMEDGASLLADTGTIAITTEADAVITGIETGNGSASAISITSTAGHILDGGDTRLDIIADTPPSATLTIYGALGIGDNPLDVRLLNLQADSGGVVDMAVQDSVHIVAVNAADRVLFSAGGDITGGAITSTGTGNHPDRSVSVTSATGGVNLASVSGVGDVTIGGQGPVQLASVGSSGGSVAIVSPGDVALGSGTAAGAFRIESTGGDVGADAITADSVSLRGAGDVSAGMLRVSSQLDLAGRTVSAQVIGGPGPVQANATGYGGGTADGIDLVLSNPGSAFVFQNLLTQIGAVDILAGRFAVDHFVVTNFARVTNPQTNLVIDQINRSIHPVDVQLYTGGAGFSLNLFDNHVMTDALTIFRSPLHDVISPDGGNVSAVDEGYNNLVRTWTLAPSAPQSSAPLVSMLIDYFGNPVGLVGNRGDGTCPSRPDLLECAQ